MSNRLVANFCKTVALAAMIGSAATYRASLIRERDGARNQVVQLTSENVTLRVSNRGLVAMTGQQNATIARLRARADAETNIVQPHHESAFQESRKARRKTPHAPNELSVAPRDGNSECAGAIRWGKARAARLSSW